MTSSAGSRRVTTCCATCSASAYHYLLSGVRGFPGAAEFAEEIRALGFADVGYQRLSFGIVAIHMARKPTA
jgi:demethylmenaquinone methyltransferase / 2-methoxy-6-polyprenyl-1,4-benzoquinol methylase